MEGNKNNSFKVKTNMVQMPVGMFMLHSFVMFFAGYEFCKHVYLHAVYKKIVCGKGDSDDADYRTDEEQDN